MKSINTLTAALALFVAQVVATPSPTIEKRAVSSIVSGTPMGFGSGATGGGTVAPVYPTTSAQLKSYLTSSQPQNIVISGTFDFSGSEGTTTVSACDIYKCPPSKGGQALLNNLGGCGSLATYNVNIDTAAYQPIWIKSDKTLVGKNNAVIKGKGFRFSGVKNVIIQNVAVTNLNPGYVWGGDAFAITDSSNIWIDHVTTSSLGRHHYSFGQGASSGVTISNSFIDGRTAYSASCDGHTYWGLILAGSSDQITFYKNHVYYTSGRSPHVGGNTLFHAVNNVWSSNTGHLIEGGENGMGVYEGNHFVNVPVTIATDAPARLFMSAAADVSKCAAYLGRNCVANTYSNAAVLMGSDTAILTLFSGKTNIVPAASAASIQNTVPSTAGNTL